MEQETRRIKTSQQNQTNETAQWNKKQGGLRPANRSRPMTLPRNKELQFIENQKHINQINEHQRNQSELPKAINIKILKEVTWITIYTINPGVNYLESRQDDH